MNDHHPQINHNYYFKRNIFLTENDSVKLGDFGVSRLIGTTIDFTSYTGTVSYMSPEVIIHRPYSYNTDCWSIGCVLYELITLDKHFSKMGGISKDEKIQEDIQNLETLEEFKILLRRMLQVKPKKRAQADEILNIFMDEN